MEALKSAVYCAQAYHAVAVALKQYNLVNTTRITPLVCYTPNGHVMDVTTMPDRRTYKPHYILMDKLEECGVWPDVLRSQTDSMANFH